MSARSGPWWRDAVVYQAYVRSFADDDGDGDGDLRGLRSRLAYLEQLGVDALWLNPCYPSPLADGGYDVADYRDIDPRFGTLDDIDDVIHEAHALGIRVLMDLVPNHTSDEHRWFRAALAAPAGSRERNRYLFRDGRGPGGEPPNDWVSIFGGPAWTRVDEPDGKPGQWYLHLFHPKQPDLNWLNGEVRNEFESILRFWFDRGVDGFRIDVAHGLAKDPQLPDLGVDPDHEAAGSHPHWDQDEVHSVYRRWRTVADSYEERLFVAELFVTPRRAARYLRPDELHMAFNFDFLEATWDAAALRAAIDESMAELAEVGARPAWVLSNHDVTRHVTRYGGGTLGTRRARAAALLMLALPGAVFMYQGEELGLPEVVDLPDDVREDPAFLRSGGAERGRDGCRVPLPWSGTEPSFGFGPSTASWLPQPAEWKELTVERQHDDPASMLWLYRNALALRRRHPALGAGDMTWLDVDDGVLAFSRSPDVLCVVNVVDEPVEVPKRLARYDQIMLASTPMEGTALIPGITAVWLSTRAGTQAPTTMTVTGRGDG